MINHPNQRKFFTFNAVLYKQMLTSEQNSLNLEYKYYFDRGDIESCEEIIFEFLELRHQRAMFCKAERRSRNYHNKRNA